MLNASSLCSFCQIPQGSASLVSSLSTPVMMPCRMQWLRAMMAVFAEICPRPVPQSFLIHLSVGSQSPCVW